MANHKVPKGTMAELLTALPITGTTYFDPIDTLEDTLGLQPKLHSRVLESMAWMIDNMCINQARTILFAHYAESDHETAQTFQDFCQYIAEALAHESLYIEEGIEQTLAQLLAVRNHWHDAAANATSADDRDYKAKSLREQMESEKAKPASIQVRVNFTKLAELEARGDAEKQKRLLDAYMQADEAATAQRVKSNKELTPVVLEVLRTANMYSNSDARFDQLPTEKQKQLTAFTIGAIDRCKVDVARRLAKQPIAFGHAAEAAYQATATLNRILKEKYSDVGELEYAGMPASVDKHNREQKRVACID